jgi:aminoglycoside 6'-N-acetyltransferase
VPQHLDGGDELVQVHVQHPGLLLRRLILPWLILPWLILHWTVLPGKPLSADRLTCALPRPARSHARRGKMSAAACILPEGRQNRAGWQHREGRGTMSTDGDQDRPPRPELAGPRVRLRPGEPQDAPLLCVILAEPEVACWWGDPEAASVVAAKLRGDDESVLLVVETAGQVIGGIEYYEENEPMYRHAGIDIYLSARGQGQGLGTEAVALLARFLFERRGHHRLTIDPAAANHRAIRSYEKVGFRRVGVLRQYERGRDGQFHDGLLMDMLRPELGAGAG